MVVKTKKDNRLKKIAGTVQPVSAVSEEEPIDRRAAYLDFGTPEELEQDDLAWASIVANTTDEQLLALEKLSRDSAKRSRAMS